MTNPITLASFRVVHKPKSEEPKPEKPKKPRRKKLDGRWWKMGRYDKWEPQCFKCTKFKRVESFTKYEDGELDLFCKSCARTINWKMERLYRESRFPKPTATVECELCGGKFVPKQFGDNPILAHYCKGCRTNHRKRIIRKAPLDQAYEQLYPHLKVYGHKTGLEIQSEGLQGPTYFDLTKTQREAALSLAKELIFKETGDHRWVNDRINPKTGNRLYTRKSA